MDEAVYIEVIGTNHVGVGLSFAEWDAIVAAVAEARKVHDCACGGCDCDCEYCGTNHYTGGDCHARVRDCDICVWVCDECGGRFCNSDEFTPWSVGDNRIEAERDFCDGSCAEAARQRGYIRMSERDDGLDVEDSVQR